MTPCHSMSLHVTPWSLEGLLNTDPRGRQSLPQWTCAMAPMQRWQHLPKAVLMHTAAVALLIIRVATRPLEITVPTPDRGSLRLLWGLSCRISSTGTLELELHGTSPAGPTPRYDPYPKHMRMMWHLRLSHQPREFIVMFILYAYAGQLLGVWPDLVAALF